jgi:uncharacterized protein
VRFLVVVRQWMGLTTLFLWLAACPDKSPSSAFGLKTVRLQIGTETLIAEVAETPEQAQTGLMFRKTLPDNQGMIFVFDPPKQANFWMKNTWVPLSIAFIDSSGKILEIRSMKPLDETPVQSASDQVAFALETNAGWFGRHGLQPGTIITGLPKG